MDESTSVSFQAYFDNALFTSDLKYTIPSLLSALSTATVLIASISAKFWTRPLPTMIFAINTSDFLYFLLKLSVVIRTPDSSFVCMLMQAINSFLLMASAAWAVLFGHAFYTVLKNKNTNVLPPLMKYYIPMTLIIPGLNGLFTFFTKNIHLLDNGVCVYRVYLGKFDWFILFHLQLPITLAISLCGLFYILSSLELRRIVIEGNVKEALTLMIYPLILMICWGPVLVLQILTECGVSIGASLAMWIRILSHLMGLFDALVYGEGMKGTLRNNCALCRRTAPKQADLEATRGEYTDLQVTRVRLDFEESFVSINHSMTSTILL